MVEVRFNVDRELFVVLGDAIMKYTANHEISSGNLLMTLMMLANEYIKQYNLPREAREFIINACIQRLVSEERDAHVGYHKEIKIPSVIHNIAAKKGN
jgi:hypothetical protein